MLKLEAILPDKVKINEEFDHIIVPGIDGDFGVYPEHTPFITKLRSGILVCFNGKDSKSYTVHDGFVTVENDHIKIVTETIESVDDIDLERAKKSQKRAEERLKESTKSDIDFRRAEASLKRSLTRMSALGHAE